MTLEMQEHVALNTKTTLKTGGNARYYTVVSTIEDLEQAIVFAEQKQLPVFVLGGGSNILVPDEGYNGLVIKMNIQGRSYREITATETVVTIGAGEVFDEVVCEVVARGLWGLENLSHIPGSVGATPIQNVGAYGVEVADVISEVSVYDSALKKVTTLQNKECFFSYRDSIFKKNKNLCIVAVTFTLSTTPNPKISYADLKSLSSNITNPQTIRDAVIAIRAAKFPDWAVVGTAGSFFKNPIISKHKASALLSKYPDIPTYNEASGMVKVSLGFILDKVCGLKGFTIGKVRLYEKQALVLVVEHGATTTNIQNFKKIISEKVFFETEILIEQEVTEI
jgi:UDP-N-acetylmuramate dehydrogenase